MLPLRFPCLLIVYIAFNIAKIGLTAKCRMSGVLSITLNWPRPSVARSRVVTRPLGSDNVEE
jgi:hypothetical protein